MTSSGIEEEKKTEKERQVLPKNVAPTNYFVSITPDLVKHCRFLGRVEIDLKVKEESDFITLNTLDLFFTKVQVKNGTDVMDIKLADLVHDHEKQQVRIPLPKKLKVDETPQLCIDYSGILTDNMKGFYRSRYTRKNGVAAYCGVTQFEATDARRALPCWDEPSVKSTFVLELTVPSDLAVLSNMPEKEEKVIGAVKTVVFQKSPIMSIYLLAWFIGEFEYVESKTSRGIDVRVWTQPGKKETATFACETACKCLDFYETYFGINYPLPKCDMIAVPDFAAGAMENWGLITYREIALLADQAKTSVRQLRHVAIVVCHELAHQWFGNLVTMDWWSQLWLNEGFACFMEYLSSDAIFPKWPMWNLFITSEYSRAFELDSMTTSHPIEVDVKTSAEAEEVFDAISYCKGASVIRMLQGYLGDETFRVGLSKYLDNFRYSNATTPDLWDYLGKEKGENVGAIMSNWTREQGFPLVYATRSGDTITLTQRRHLSSGELTQEQENVVWSIPMKLRVGGKTMTVLFNKKKDVVKVDQNAEWVHLNADSTGFYACLYDKPMTDALAKALKTGDKNLTELDKVCLIRDASAVAESRARGATENLLNLIISFKGEESYPVLDALLNAAQAIRHIIDTDEATSKNFDKIMRDTLLPLFKKVGWDGSKDEDADIEALVRPLALGAISKYGYQPVTEEALKRFRAFMDLSQEEKQNDKNKAYIASSLRSIVYSIAVKNGGKSEFEALKNYYLRVEDPAEKQWALRALGTTKDPELITNLLHWLKDSDDVRNQDKVFPFRIVSQGVAGRDIAWNFLQKTFDEWHQKFEGGFLVQHLAKIPSEFVSFQKAEEVEKFYSGLNYPSCKRSMDQCVESINKNAKWREQEIGLIEKWTTEQAKKCQ